MLYTPSAVSTQLVWLVSANLLPPKQKESLIFKSVCPKNLRVGNFLISALNQHVENNFYCTSGLGVNLESDLKQENFKMRAMCACVRKTHIIVRLQQGLAEVEQFGL